ncbi:hypothetical protein BS78_06G221500 [Paspalum vaginatum]|nr:hypothetical protein BS78_06G221500 [Paspalum vaginatum]
MVVRCPLCLYDFQDNIRTLHGKLFGNFINGIVTAMTINYGVLLGFVPSNDSVVLLQSGQFKGVVRLRGDDLQKPIDNPENINWESYARDAVYAQQSSGYDLRKVTPSHLPLRQSRSCYASKILTNDSLVGYISGVKGLHSSGLSSSAAVTVYLCSSSVVSPVDNIQLDKSIENKYLGLENGILDPSAILLSRYGYLTFMDCKLPFKILLAFSGLKHNLPKKQAARALLHASGCEDMSSVLRNVDLVVYKAHKVTITFSSKNLSRRAEHYFSEMKRIAKGRDAWARGSLQEPGLLISASGRSSILNYECGSKEMTQLYEILLKAPGVLRAWFSGAGFRRDCYLGCCPAIVESDLAENAASYVRDEYEKAQPELLSKIPADRRVLVCEPGDSARVILPGHHHHS